MLPLEDTQHPTDTGSRREGWGVTSPMRTVGFSFLFFKMLACALESTYTEYGCDPARKLWNAVKAPCSATCKTLWPTSGSAR